MAKRFYISLLCVCFVGFCLSFAALQMVTFQGFTDEGLIFELIHHRPGSPRPIWFYLTVGFLSCTVLLVWRVLTLKGKA